MCGSRGVNWRRTLNGTGRTVTASSDGPEWDSHFPSLTHNGDCQSYMQNDIGKFGGCDDICDQPMSYRPRYEINLGFSHWLPRQPMAMQFGNLVCYPDNF